jgi:hypothetical protein
MLPHITSAAGQSRMRRRAVPSLPPRRVRGIHDHGAQFTPLIDAKAAGRLLGGPTHGCSPRPAPDASPTTASGTTCASAPTT